MASSNTVRQLVIIHISDVHYGATHSFDPPKSADGDVPAGRDYPTLLEKLQEDLSSKELGGPIMVAISGDLAQTGSLDQLERAADFVRGLTTAHILGSPCQLANVFIVPGNHDVVFDGAQVGARWQQWVEFHNRLRGTRIDRDEPWDLDAVDDRVDDLGAIVATLNSAVHVEKGKPDEIRGRIEAKQIDVLRKRLRAIDPGRRKGAIRIAIIHHHPVLIPDLVEPGRRYDAIQNSAKLLTTLREFGFHLLLHGHKHNPHVFTEDSAPAYRTGEPQPLMIVAGGSVSSTELPPRCGNCYNRIDVKWNPVAEQTRIRVRTRGLTVIDDAHNDLLPWDWTWQDLRVDDRQFIGGKEVPVPLTEEARAFDPDTDLTAERQRSAEYQRLNWWFPVTAVMPSLEPGQVNEVRLWFVRHRPPHEVDPGPLLDRVTWSAGPRFPVVSVSAERDPMFCAALHYYGPMLVQAHMEFDDGTAADAHIYVRLPEALGSL